MEGVSLQHAFIPISKLTLVTSHAFEVFPDGDLKSKGSGVTLALRLSGVFSQSGVDADGIGGGVEFVSCRWGMANTRVKGSIRWGMTELGIWHLGGVGGKGNLGARERERRTIRSSTERGVAGTLNSL